MHCVLYGVENDTIRHHLAIFRVDVPFAHHFMAPTTPTLHPYIKTYSIGYACEKLPKMVGNLASYPFNSWYIDRL